MTWVTEVFQGWESNDFDHDKDIWLQSTNLQQAELQLLNAS